MPLAHLQLHGQALRIATLNYDTTVETLGEIAGFSVDTGMDEWDSTGKLTFRGHMRLYKLHGSIDWKLTRHVVISSEDPMLPYESVESQKNQTPEEPALIFGAGNKLRAGGPYLQLLRLFEESLEEYDALLIVGYSFRDDHVNTVITRWMNTQHSRRVVILDKGADRFRSFALPPERTLGHDLAAKTGRAILIQASTADGLEEAISQARGR